MANSSIALDEPAVIDKRVDTEQLTVAAVVVERERMQVAGATDVEIARVQNTNPTGTEQGLVVRQISGVVSTNNSSTATLGISGVFTGVGDEVKDYATITVLVKSDVASAVDGLSVQYSPDNVNWDDTDLYTITANTGKFFTFAPEGRYFRIVYTNGGTAQTFFRLQTIFHYQRTKPSSHRISEANVIDDENDAELVVGIVHGSHEHDDVDNGRPVKIGGFAKATAPTAVADSDRVNAWFTTDGRLHVADGNAALSVDDNAASLTVDAPVATPVATRLSDGAAFIDPRDVSDRAARLVGQVEGRAADGIAVAGNPVRIAGKDGGGLTQDIATDASGELQVDVLTMPSVTIGTFPDNEPFNISQVGGSAVDTAGAGRQEIATLPVIADPVDGAGTAVPIKYVRVNATADGDNVIVAAVGGKKIRVLGYVLTCTAVGLISLQDTAGTPVIHGQIRTGADGGGAAYSGGLSAPAFETAVGTGVEINVPAGVDCLGHMTYIEV